MYTVNGIDLIQIDGRTLQLANGTTAQLTFPNNISEKTVGKNQNALYAKNSTGTQGQLVIRLPVGNADDKYLNTKLTQWENSPQSFILMTGYVSKPLGDGFGKTINVSYNLGGGVILKYPDYQEVAEGDVEQVVAVWTIDFTTVKRVIG